MDATTLRGLVYLVLTLVGLAGVWIGILYVILNKKSQRLVQLELENADLKRRLEKLRIRVETRGMTDDELLEDVSGLLADL